MGPLPEHVTLPNPIFVYRLLTYCHIAEEIQAHDGSLITECNPIYLYFGLSQGTYLTNKHTHFTEIKKTESAEIIIEIDSVYQKNVVSQKEDILTLMGPLLMNMPLPIPILFGVRCLPN